MGSSDQENSFSDEPPAVIQEGQAESSPGPEGDTARAMSKENVEAYKRAVEATNRRDFEALLEEFDPEVEWSPKVVGMGSGVYRGAEGVREMFGDMDETISDAFFEVSEIRDLGDRLLALAASAPTAGERRSDRSPVQPVGRLQDGKATVLRTFLDPKEALEAAGLSE